MHTFICSELIFQHYSTKTLYFSLSFCFFAHPLFVVLQILLNVVIHKSPISKAPPSSQPKPPYLPDTPYSVSSDSVWCVSVRVWQQPPPLMRRDVCGVELWSPRRPHQADHMSLTSNLATAAALTLCLRLTPTRSAPHGLLFHLTNRVHPGVTALPCTSCERGQRERPAI